MFNESYARNLNDTKQYHFRTERYYLFYRTKVTTFNCNYIGIVSEDFSLNNSANSSGYTRTVVAPLNCRNREKRTCKYAYKINLLHIPRLENEKGDPLVRVCTCDSVKFGEFKYQRSVCGRFTEPVWRKFDSGFENWDLRESTNAYA